MNYQKGFVASLVAIFVLGFMISLAMSMSAIVLIRHGIAENDVKALQSYYAAESGIEDSLLRLKNNPQIAAYNYIIDVNNFEVNVQIPEAIAGSRAIVSQGDFYGRIKKVRAVYTINTDDVSFYYGIQSGDLGVQMASNAVVNGNIFSNGPIIGASNVRIYGDVISAGPDGSIQDVAVKEVEEAGGNAWAVNCEDSQMDQYLYYTVEKGSGCTAGDEKNYTEEYVEKEDLPIDLEQILSWKNQALAGGTPLEGYTLDGSDVLGPVKVQGDMVLVSNSILTIEGTIWVTGDLILDSNTVLQLSSGYSTFSGVIVVDGQINLAAGTTICGAEGYKGSSECNNSIGSYLLLLSTKSSSDFNDPPAILATSNTSTAILYTTNGFIRLSANSDIKEATGYGIYMDSNADVTYETGLANALFSSGPGGGWQVESWEEIE